MYLLYPKECITATGIKKSRHQGMKKAGDGNRTHVSSLEGWCSTIELHPHILSYPEGVRPLFYFFSECLVPESNQRHEDFQSSALPTELTRHWNVPLGNGTFNILLKSFQSVKRFCKIFPWSSNSSLLFTARETAHSNDSGRY